MKKVLAISLAVIMMVCMSFSVFAKPGEFIQSPSVNKKPTLVESTVEAVDCVARIVITAFLDRAELPDELRELIEKAYKEIATTENLTFLCEGLFSIAEEMGIPVGNLVVSDLFDIRYEDCADHEGHGYFDITIKSETFNNFVALIHRTDDGWEVIDNAEVKEVDGEYHLIFRVDSFSPFAVVVNSAVIADENPKTGDNNNIYIYGGIMVIAVAAAAALVIFKKKEKQAV